MKPISWMPVDAEKQVWACQYYVPSFVSRTIAFLSKQGKPLVVGPGGPLAGSLPEEWASFGEPAIALLPNAFHYMGLTAWLEKYPRMVPVAAPGAMARLKRKGCRNLQSLEQLKKELPENIRLLEPEGLGYGEVWLEITSPQETLWLVCDAFFNLPRFSRKPFTRFTQKCLQAAPGLKISSVVKYFLIKDRRRYRDWVIEQLQRNPPTTLIPAHGDILSASDLSERIQALVLKRL